MVARGTLWTLCGEPYGTSAESFQKVADPRRTVLDSIETCASLCKLREPFCNFWNLCRTFQKLLVRFRTLEQKRETWRTANRIAHQRTLAKQAEPLRTQTAESLRELERTVEDRAERWRTVANLGEPERTLSNIE